ncbi:MAG: chemotaxis protein CheD [Bacillota bacterium]|jgi:chemotaxis protein CheD|nr:chemotaxis protein CheD [Bacillota bacterium]
MPDEIYVEKVGIADMRFVKAPDRIRTSGLGSCVGLVIYDLDKKLAGLAHVMLPESSLSKVTGFNPAKYADTAVEVLVSKLLANGARRYALKAKMAGGAQMFQFATNNEMMRIGPRNVEAIKRELERLKITLITEDVGGNSGRTIEFDPHGGLLSIKTIHQGTKLI